ncbi:MAG: bacillithiol biosynthesis cysteine-adding enzyme BshC [Rhodothermia bacterium]|nr:bacillithiol biosynthesis cysteine-adding enzyme BshC [Rhodothermia bacterium]
MQSVAAIDLLTSSRPFSAMDGFSRLFRDYCEHFDRVARFYASDYRSLEDIALHANAVNAFGRDRDLLADTLLSQNEEWALDDATRNNIERLRQDGSLAVVTGQQVGMLGGPLYTIYKTSTAIALSRKLAESSGMDVVPIFWLEGEDHDLDEVKTVHLLSRNETVSLTYDIAPLNEGENHGPVGRLKLGDAITGLLDQLDDLLPPTDFKPELMKMARDAYQPGVSMRTAFARLLKSLFPDDGLIFISPDDRRFKSAAVPLFLQEVDGSQTLVDSIRSVSRELESDYHTQLTVSPTNLFFINQHGRFAIDLINDDQFVVRGQSTSFSKKELAATIEKDPCCISPNVVLRPILQDRILPTVAYVGGPGEIAYFAQLKPAYEWFGLPMPAVYPRASVTIVEAKVRKLLDEYGLDVSEAGKNANDLFRQVVLDQMDVDLSSEFQKAGSHLHEGVNAIKSVATSVDGSMTKSVEATRAAIVKEWKRLEEKVLKAEKRRHDEDRDRLRRLQTNLFPNGKPQERSLSIIYFLNKYGPGFLGELQSGISFDLREHQIIDIQSA